MKKFMLLVSLLCVCFLLVGCVIKEDRSHATVEIETSRGESFTRSSSNGYTTPFDGKEQAILQVKFFELKDGETANVHFYCDACGHEEYVTLTAPDAKLLECDCPEVIDENDNSREYVAIVVGSKETLKSATESIGK